MTTILNSGTFVSPPSGATLPDSLTYGGGSIWVEYGNGADPNGLSGNSTIVQYSLAGTALNTYTLPGHADGLKYDSATNTVWGLSNEDGPSTVSLINATTGLMSAPMSYADPALSTVNVAANLDASRGVDDVVFAGSKVYISETIPTNSGDAVIDIVNNGPAPFGPLTLTPILAFGATGTNLLTGATGVIPLNDPDSLKVLPDGTLMMTSGDDGSVTFVHNPGTPQQSQTFLNIPGTTAGGVGLDDTIVPQTANGTLYIADSNHNVVTKIALVGLTPNDLIASVGSLKAVVDVNMTTGAVTTIASGLSGPHGMVFLGSDGTVANDAPAGLPTNANLDTGEVTRLYQAALGRTGDVQGVKFWSGLLDNTTATLGQVTAGFVATAEFKALTGTLSDQQFVDQEYKFTLNRAGDAPGEAGWLKGLSSGGLSRADVVGGFASSAEGQALLAPNVASVHSMLG